MSETVHLKLPLVGAAQAQKHLTVNEAFNLLDALLQLAVISAGDTDPPATPADGDRYLVGAAATGAWAGWDDTIAYYFDGAWSQLTPQDGWRVFVVDTGDEVRFSGGNWASVGAAATPTIASIGDVTITTIAAGEIIVWDGVGGWYNATLAEASIAAVGHTHAAADVTSGTFADARIAATNVTQHQAALTLTESQISDLGAYITTAGVTFEALNANLDVGTGAAQVAAGDHLHAGVYEPVDADILRADTSDSLTAGFTSPPEDLGTISTGTTNIAVTGAGQRNVKMMINGGASTLNFATLEDGASVALHITNSATAGALTLSGLSATPLGVSLDTTSGNTFVIQALSLNGTITASILAGQ